METQNATSINPPNSDQMLLLQQRLALEGQIKNGVSWFYWIAGLSAINTLVFAANGALTFAVGLGVTQVIDAFAGGFAEAMAPDFGPTVSFVVRAFGIGLSLAFAGVFIVLGVLGMRRHQWVVLAGMIFYGLDALVLLAFGDWLGILFHGLGLWGLWRGFIAIRAWTALTQNRTPGSAEAYQQYLSATQTQPVSTGSRKIGLIFGGVALLLVLCLLVFVLWLLPYLQ